jgi:Carbohydrate esterase, sialic acid-specific acetylesterase/Right handed beta helix region/Ig-like domain CHU_C associated
MSGITTFLHFPKNNSSISILLIFLTYFSSIFAIELMAKVDDSSKSTLPILLINKPNQGFLLLNNSLKLKPLEKNFGVEVFEVNNSLASCDNGSSPFSIYSASYSNGVVTFIFNAANLSQGSWKVQKGTAIVSQGTFTPTSSAVDISVGILTAGTYQLIIDGVSCVGSATKSFTINPINPPTGVSCDNGVTPFYIVSTAYNKGLLTFEVNANNFSSGIWTIKQGSTVISTTNFSVTGNIMTVNAGALPAGAYDLQMDGVSCNGSTNKTFKVAPPYSPQSSVSVAACNSDKFLFVLVGESNAGGKASNTELSTLEIGTRDSLKIFNNDSFQFESLKVGTNNLISHFTLINGTTHGMEVAIANRVRQQQSFYNNTAYLVKAGQGKSLITDWDTSGVYYKSLVTRTQVARQLLASNNVSYKTVILYSQGINDIIAGVPSFMWKANTKNHFQNLRNELGSNTLIVITRFMPQYSAYNGVIDEICSELPNTYAVDTWDAGLLDDKHWNASGFKLIGGRMLSIVESKNFTNATRSVNAASTSTVSISNVSICEGSNQLLTAVPTNGGSTPLFQWYKNNEALPFFINKYTTDGLGNNLINSVTIGNDNKVYAGTAKGLSISSDGGNTFINKITNGNPSSNSIRGVAVSSAGVIYVATAFDGINISTDGGNTFSSKKTTQGLASNNTRGIYVDDNNGKLYIATASGLSISTDGGNTFSTRTTNWGLASNNLQCVVVGNDGKIYVGTSTGGMSISSDGGNSFTTYNTSNGLGDGNVFSIYVNSSGKIFAATALGLSISNDGGSHFDNYTTSNGLGDDFVYKILVTADNRIFAGTYGGGLSTSTDGGTTFTNYTTVNGLGDDRVRAIGMDSNGKLFVGTNASLSIGNQINTNITNAKASDKYSVSMQTICPVNAVTTSTIITIIPNPIAPTLASSSICANSGTSTSLTATCATGTPTWYSTNTSTPILGTNAFTTGNLTVTTDFYVACEVGTSPKCVSNRTKLTVNIGATPNAPIVVNQSAYLGNSTSLQASGCSGFGTTLKWYESASNTLVSTPFLPTTTKNYYAKCEQAVSTYTCVSPKSLDVVLSVIQRVFVDSTKVLTTIQDGNTWATAFGNLPTGLTSASSGMEVWVAKGTYKPTTGTTRTTSLTVPSGVKIYGGFTGTESLLTQRNSSTNATVLSGEIGILSVNTDNSYHVVSFDASDNNTLLDGFTITGGNANFTSVSELSVPYTATTTATDNTGGGIVMKNGANPTISNCTIKLNSAKVGGGIFCSNGSIANIKSCKIIANIASIGGAIYTQQASNIAVRSSQITGNKGNGEAFYNNSATPTITNCTLVGSGGTTPAIYNGTSSPSIFQNCIIWGYSTPFNDVQSVVSYSNLSGSYVGIGNSNIDPLFASALPINANVSVAGDFHLTALSTMIDAGNSAFVLANEKDVETNNRVFGRVDLGAFEFQGARTGGTLTSIKTGNWEDGTTWDAGRKPYAGDTVIISNNHTISINSIAIAKSITYKLNTMLKFVSNTTGLQIGL